MRKIIIALLVLATVVIQANAQQAQRYTNYLFNAIYTNPAVAGSSGYTNLMGSYRKQWTGIDQSPSTRGVSADGQLLGGQAGWGLQYNSDKLGALEQSTFSLNVSYKIAASEVSSLSLGISAGVFNSQININELARQGFINDPALPMTSEKFMSPDFKIGAFYQGEKFFGALSVLNLNNIEINEGSYYTGVDYGKHYYLTLGLMQDIHPSWTFMPSTQLRRSEAKRMEMDITAQFMYMDKFTLGTSFKLDGTRSTLESVSFLIDYNLSKTLRALYAYDITTSELASVANASHELGIGLRVFNKNSVVPQAIHTRHFHN